MEYHRSITNVPDLDILFLLCLVSRLNYVIFAATLRGGAVAARWAHNPKVGSSNLPTATKKTRII